MAQTKEAIYQKKLENLKICSICYKKYAEFGNNASPINTGRCCNDCNNLVVIARINSRSVIKEFQNA